MQNKSFSNGIRDRHEIETVSVENLCGNLVPTYCAEVQSCNRK